MNKKSLTIELPWAPTTNTFLRHFILPDRKYPSTCISRKGKEFYAAVDKILSEKKYPMLKGPLFAFIELYPPDRRKIDIDNRNKPILDSLKFRPKDKKQTLDAWVFIEDDSQVKCLLTVMLDLIPGGKVVIHLKQIDIPSFYKKIRLLLLDDDCPDPNGSVCVPDFAYEQRSLFDG